MRPLNIFMSHLQQFFFSKKDTQVDKKEYALHVRKKY